MVTVEKSAVKMTDQNYMTVPVDLVTPGQRFEFDLYLHLNGNFVLYASAGSIFGREHLRTMRESGTTMLYAKRSDPAHIRYYENNLSRILHEDRINTDEKSKILVSVTSHLIKDVMEDPQSATAVKRSKEAVGNMVDFILTQADSFFNLARLTSPDYQAYTHAVNVCTLALGLGRRVGIRVRTDFISLGLGALLHDIGKRAIDPNILDKPGPLTPSEWQILRKHPEWGLKMLTDIHALPPEALKGLDTSQTAGLPPNLPELSTDTLAVIEQHHEACNGQGYPRGLVDKEIHLFAKIVKIVDIYDSMSTNRVYKKGETPFKVIKLMTDAFVHEIDQRIFKEFILLLGFGIGR